ncbi:MAG: hypothetical protein JWQ71_2146 [Pedosphaera sp.]|nr:hypothetical protein [Pedosphaera sp.]
MEESTQKKSILWTRLSSMAVAAIALLYVFRHVDLAELKQAFLHSRPGWLIAAIAVYGAAFPPAAWRWHLMLRLTGNAVHFTATMIMTLIGHFFYTLFFGVAGGDVAKSALYARWYRLPLPEILAAAPLDRLLGLGGLIFFLLLAFGLAALHGAFLHLEATSLRVPTVWVIVTLALILLAWIALKRWGHGSGVSRWLHALSYSGKQMIASWSITWQGLLCGFLVQVALAGSLALCLQAVSHSALPWGQLLWTFPVISIISAVPFTVAGLGFREGAALALLGLYGVSAADAVAASLLTLVARLFWAAVGGTVLWREQRFQSSQSPLPKTISAIIPTPNELHTLGETIQRLRNIPEICEIIVMDDGSQDELRKIATQLDCRVIASPSGRELQLRLAAVQAMGDVILLLHADMWLPANAGKAIMNCLRDAHAAGGGFSRRLTGDQEIFIRRKILEELDNAIDTRPKEKCDLYRCLRKKGRLVLADAIVISSARSL